jgi:hypothetical protein
MQYLFILLAVLLLSFNTPIENKVVYSERICSAGEIPYQSGKKLNWCDFTFSEERKDRVVATATTGLYYSFSKKGNKLEVNVCAYFSKPESFVVCGKEIDHVLNHEQKHFDITYLFSLKLIQKCRTYHNLNVATVERLHNQIQQELDEFQARYDLETTHSLNKGSQLQWNKMIADEIKEMKRELNY